MYEKKIQKLCSNFRYTREEMLLIRELKSSRTRPSILSEDFNNDDGLFSPDKWLQHRWECEGVENRSLKKKKISSLNRTENVISNHDLEQTVLSPQRRGFSCGCRAPSPKINEDKPNSKSRWRHGHLNNGVDFKPSFQKNALEQTRHRSNNSVAWRNNNSHSQSEKIYTDKTNRNRNFDDKLEKMPEWLEEGPSSMTEIIELKGFEDDVKEKKTKKRKNKDMLFKSGNCSSNSASTGTNAEELLSSQLTNKYENKNTYQHNSRPSSQELIELIEKSAEQKIETTTKIIDETQKNVKDQQIYATNTINKEITDDSLSDMVSNLLANNKEKKSIVNSTSVFNKNILNSQVQSTLSLNNVEEKSFTSFFEPDNTLSSNIAKNIPNSDAEFAAFLGILDVDPSTIKFDPVINNVNQPSSSRLSRFFCKNSNALSSYDQSKEDLTHFEVDNNAQNSQQQQRAIIGQNSINGLNFGKNNKQKNVLPLALKELFAAASPKSHITNDLNGGMTVEELERYLTLKFHHSTNLDEINHTQKSSFPLSINSENVPLFYQQQRISQNTNYLFNSGNNNNLDFSKNDLVNNLSSGTFVPNSSQFNYQALAAIQQQKHNYYNPEHQNQMFQQLTQRNTSMLRKLFSNATTKFSNEINGGMTVQELEREIAYKAMTTGSRGNNNINNNNNNNNNNINNNSNINNNNNTNFMLPSQLQLLSQQQSNTLSNRQNINDLIGSCTNRQLPAPPLTLLCGNIANKLTSQQQNQLIEQFLSARAFLEHLHQQNPQQFLMHMAHLQKSMVLQCRLLVASNAIPPDLNQMRAAGTQLVQMGHDPTVVATYLARNANTVGSNLSNASIASANLQQNNPIINEQHFINNNNENETNVNYTNNFDQTTTESLSISSVTNKPPSNVNVAAFMPTSVLRQMTKVPSGNGSGNNSGAGGIGSPAIQSSPINAESAIIEKILSQKSFPVFDNNELSSTASNSQFRLQNSLFDAASFASDQQQFNLARRRGDLVSAQAIRARMVAQVEALAGVPPLQDSLKMGTLR